MDKEEYSSWVLWAKQYLDDIRIPTGMYASKPWGTWAGESIGYVSNDKMLQLIQFKLGPAKINKIIEFKIKDNK